VLAPIAAAQHTEKAKPNIVVILADDMGFSDLGSYGGEIETPTLDAIASAGLRFTNFTNTAKCHSSRIALLSGLWPNQAGNKSLSKAATFPELLKHTGYATAMVGKWHLKKTPHDFGFEKYFGHLSGASDFIKGNDTFLLGGKAFNDFGSNADGFYLTDVNTDYAINFMQEWREAKDERPFLLYMAYNAPHFPLQAPEKLVRKYRGRYMAGWKSLRAARFERQKKLGLFDDESNLPELPSFQRRWDDLSMNEKSWEDYRMAIYAAMIDSLDSNIGRLVADLKANGQWKNTLFVFVSDNGGNPFERSTNIQTLPWHANADMHLGKEWASLSNTPFRHYKQNAHRGGVSSPAIIHWPAGLKATGWNDTAAHLVDISPTLLDLAGATYPKTYNGTKVPALAGVSLAPLFRGKPVLRDKPIYYNHANNVGLLIDNFKLVSFRGGPWELYNLSVDPIEADNLAISQPERIKKMSSQWVEMAKNVDHAPKKERVARATQSVPWGVYARKSSKHDKGDSKYDEQNPNWQGLPPLPLPEKTSTTDK
jgi:arylsulfatase